MLWGMGFVCGRRWSGVSLALLAEDTPDHITTSLSLVSVYLSNLESYTEPIPDSLIPILPLYLFYNAITHSGKRPSEVVFLQEAMASNCGE